MLLRTTLNLIQLNCVCVSLKLKKKHIGVGLPLQETPMELDSISIRPRFERILGLFEGRSDQRASRLYRFVYL